MQQFEIKPLVPFEFAGFDLAFTNSSLWMLIALVATSLFFALATSSSQKLIPSRLQLIAEGAYNFIASMISDNLGAKGKEYFPLIFALFFFILMCNMLGMIPYSFTVTSHLAVTAALALLVFLIVLVMGFVKHGLHFLHLFVPSGVPGALMPMVVLIELISFLSRPITLSVRLFANMVAGHVMLKVIAGFAVMFATVGGAAWIGTIFPVILNILMIGFEFFIAFIQAYVFAVLTCIYLKDTLEIEH